MWPSANFYFILLTISDSTKKQEARSVMAKKKKKKETDNETAVTLKENSVLNASPDFHCADLTVCTTPLNSTPSH